MQHIRVFFKNLYHPGGSSPAACGTRLNLGDCFAYALAKTQRIPLLYKGGDFDKTDIEPAL